jgi:Phage P22-like portal protein
MADHEKTESICTEARERYSRAMDALSESRRLSNEDTKFVMGDADNMYQYPEAARNNTKPRYTINISAQHCNQVINNMRMSRPETKVIPGGLHAHKKAADIIEGMLRSIRASSNADVAHDIAAEQCVYGGEGYWYIDTEYETDTGFDQIIKVYPIPDFNKVLVDPSARLPDKSDAEWGFMSERISKDRCKREHPDCEPSSWAKEEYWVDNEEVIRTVYWYCEHKQVDVCLLEDGSTCYKSDHDGITPITKTRKATRKQWWRCVLLGGEDKPVEKIAWPGQYLPIISAVGKELVVDGQLTRKGEVRDLKDAQRIVNYSFSAAVETITLQNKIPYIAAHESINGFEGQWQNANQSNAAYLPYRQYDAEGRQLEKPQRQEPAVMPSAQIQMLQIATEQMRAASGQNNANFGIRSEAASGIGIQRLKQQGDTAAQVRGYCHHGLDPQDLRHPARHPHTGIGWQRVASGH